MFPLSTTPMLPNISARLISLQQQWWPWEKHRASIVHEIIVRFSRDFYETILVGKFPSRKISEKCSSHRSRITDIQTQSFLPFHRTQRNVWILAVISFRVSGRRNIYPHHNAGTCSELACRLASGRHNYRVNTRGNRWPDRHSDDHLVYSLYFPPHNVQAAVARIKERCVDNAVGFNGQRWCRRARQPQVQSKMDVLGGLPATATEAAVLAEHQLNPARSRQTDRENGYENWSLVFSYERSLEKQLSSHINRWRSSSYNAMIN